jgi:hypothetical protein
MKISRLICLSLLLAFAGGVHAQNFGGEVDVDYAKDLWKAMTEAGFASPEELMSRPYAGQHPHGAILDTIEGKINIHGERLRIIVKRNYSGPGISITNVSTNPEKYIKGLTVMLKRPGYDPQTQDWFWVKYKPDGQIETNPAGTPLAGKVAKGKAKGCIACHNAAPGGDMLFLRN